MYGKEGIKNTNTVQLFKENGGWENKRKVLNEKRKNGQPKRALGRRERGATGSRGGGGEKETRVGAGVVLRRGRSRR